MATLYERYNTGDNGNHAFYKTSIWQGQTFTPSTDHTITSVKVKLLRFADSVPGTLTARIYAINGGTPTGSALVSGTYAAGNDITTTSPGEWIEITLGSGYLLRASTVYALVMISSTDDQTKPIYWRRDSSSPTYTDGSRVSTANGGTSWTLDTAIDFMFEEYGDAAGTGGLEVTNQGLTAISGSTATGHGTIVDTGASSVTQHGFCWATTIDPTTADSKTTDGSGSAGVFTSSITGLSEGTIYYARPYATNTEGTVYGANVRFRAGFSYTQLVKGNITVKEISLHYVDKYGVERYLTGTPV